MTDLQVGDEVTSTLLTSVERWKVHSVALPHGTILVRAFEERPDQPQRVFAWLPADSLTKVEPPPPPLRVDDFIDGDDPRIAGLPNGSILQHGAWGTNLVKVADQWLTAKRGEEWTLARGSSYRVLFIPRDKK